MIKIYANKLNSMTLNKGLLVLLGLVFFLPLMGQKKLQVASKTINRNIVYKEGDRLNIDAHKAKIFVDTWEKDEVRIRLRITSKHPEKQTASRDLEKMQIEIEKESGEIYIKNFLDTEKAKSSLHAVYQVTVPVYCPLNLKNDYGNANIDKLHSNLDVEGEFCPVQLSNVKGEVNITSYYGDIEAKYISGSVNIDSRRSNIDMAHLTGVYNIQATYAIVKINAHPSLVSLDINADKSDVYFDTPKLDAFTFSLLAEHGAIKVPKELEFALKKNKDYLKQAVLNKGMANGASINISTTFGKIHIGDF